MTEQEPHSAEQESRAGAQAFWEEFHGDDPDMSAEFESAYLGDYASPAAWARETVKADELQAKVEANIGDELAEFYHFDAEGFAELAWRDSFILIAHKDGGGCWIFRGPG